MFWSIFLHSAAAILVILLVGELIAWALNYAGKNSGVDRDG